MTPSVVRRTVPNRPTIQQTVEAGDDPDESGAAAPLSCGDQVVPPSVDRSIDGPRIRHRTDGSGEMTMSRLVILLAVIWSDRGAAASMGGGAAAGAAAASAFALFASRDGGASGTRASLAAARCSFLVGASGRLPDGCAAAAERVVSAFNAGCGALSACASCETCGGSAA